MEIWKIIPSLQDHYEASSLGRIRRTSKARGTRTGKILTPQINKSNGRYYVMTTIDYKQKGFLVSRLICEAFHGPAPFLKADVDHIDNDKLNNVPDNLQWLTRSANIQKSYDTGLRTPNGPKISVSQKKRHRERPESTPRGENHWGAKYSESQIMNILIAHRAEPTLPLTKLSKKLGVTYNTCWRVVRRKAWTHIKL